MCGICVLDGTREKNVAPVCDQRRAYKFIVVLIKMFTNIFLHLSVNLLGYFECIIMLDIIKVFGIDWNDRNSTMDGG